MILSKEKIKESFSRAAITYDGPSDLQKEVGLRLIDVVSSEKIEKNHILDVGMGTGSTTQTLAKALNRPIYGCDIAWGMVSFSKKNTEGICISQADAEELPYRTGAFDIVFSNIVYQWVSDFRKAFLEIKRVLRQNGSFYFSILIEGSLKELYETLTNVFHKDYSVTFLPNAKYIKLELKWQGFNIIHWEELSFKRYYKDCLALLWALKKIGTGRFLESNIFNMGQRGQFFKMLDAYDKNFNEGGRIFATYKVILGCAERI